MDLRALAPDIRLGTDVRVSALSAEIGTGVFIGERVVIETENLTLGDGARIGDSVTIRADDFTLGEGSEVETRSQLGHGAGGARLIRIGEQSFLAHDTKVLAPVVVIGDYSAIHNHSLCNGRGRLVVGHNCWIGQNCVLNAEDELRIGNNVGIGAYSTVYTHGYFGDRLHGSNVFNVAPVDIEDDVWILGGFNTISPGVTLGERALVLPGSNVTKDVPPNHTVAGSPARDLTDRLTPYRNVDATEKLDTMREYLAEYVAAVRAHATASDRAVVVEGAIGRFGVQIAASVEQVDDLVPERPLLLFVAAEPAWAPPDDVTVFDVVARTYTRQRTKPEISMIRFLKSYRARFVPTDCPRVTIDDAHVSSANTSQ